MWPVVIALKQWGDRSHEWPEGGPLRLRHKSCGDEMQPRLTCSSCGEEVGPRDVALEMTREMAAERKMMAGAKL